MNWKSWLMRHSHKSMWGSTNAVLFRENTTLEWLRSQGRCGHLDTVQYSQPVRTGQVSGVSELNLWSSRWHSLHSTISISFTWRLCSLEDTETVLSAWAVVTAVVGRLQKDQWLRDQEETEVWTTLCAVTVSQNVSQDKIHSPVSAGQWLLLVLPSSFSPCLSPLAVSASTHTVLTDHVKFNCYKLVCNMSLINMLTSHIDDLAECCYLSNWQQQNQSKINSSYLIKWIKYIYKYNL